MLMTHDLSRGNRLVCACVCVWSRRCTFVCRKVSVPSGVCMSCLHTHTHTHIGLRILHAIEKRRGTLQCMHDHVHVLLHCSYLPVSVCKYRFTIHHRFVKPIYQSSFSMTEIKETHKQLSNCIIIQRKQNPVHTDHHIKLTLNKSIWPVLFAGLFLCVFSDISELESFASIDSRTEVSFCHRIAFQCTFELFTPQLILEDVVKQN